MTQLFFCNVKRIGAKDFLRISNSLFIYRKMNALIKNVSLPVDLNKII